MKLTLFTDDLREVPADLLAVGVFSDEPDRGLAFSHLNAALDGVLEQACRDERFRGEPGQSVLFNAGPGIAARRVLVYGFGERRLYGPESARRFAGTVTRTCRTVGAASAALVLTIRDVPAPAERIVDLVQALAEGSELGSYAFLPYRTKDPDASRLKDLRVCFAAEDVQGVRGAMLRDALARGQVLAQAVAAARDLVNEPPNTLTPTAFAEAAKRMAKASGLGLRVLGPRDLERQRMGLLLGVAKGSEEEPRLIHLVHEPEGVAKKGPLLTLVGKGLTFDSGGLSLKDTENMLPMKSDMGGAAAVFGAMKAVAELKLPCRVHGIIGAVENMPDGRAVRPSDVLRSRKGLTVEVVNTDAEGRLVLADLISYALDLEPTELIDVATLTGACIVALGRTMAGAFVDDEEMARDLEAAWHRSGERFWRMPIDPEMRDELKSDVADIKNLGERYGGAISAALFLREFVGADLSRFAHLDIAGPVMSVRELGYWSKGGTGFGVRTLVEYVRRRAASGSARE